MDEFINGFPLEISRVLNEISTKIQQNNSLEAQAIVGYNEQISMIDNGIKVCKDMGADDIVLAYLEMLKKATEEKISDELNHSTTLNLEYVELTGIKVKET